MREPSDSIPLVSKQRVRLSGLIGRPELNGLCGSILLFDEAKGRYAVKLDKGETEPILIRRDCLLLEMDSNETRAARRATLVAHAARQHALKIEATTYASQIGMAQSRAEVPDDIWDKVVEVQREVQVACNACDAEFPTLLLEAIQADDASCWSHSAVEYSFYLLGQVRRSSDTSSPEPPTEGKRLATRVLRIHGCGGRCRDAMLASAVQAAEGPFSRDDAQQLLAAAPEVCPTLKGEEWIRLKERDAMQRELQDSWDRDTEERLAKKSAEACANLVKGGALQAV